MDRLITILRAVHCRSTHHYFAIDGLQFVRTDAGRRLASILLKHHDRYLTGAKDPDDSFRDFENHVLHVQDNMWGGAIHSAETWHAKWVSSLRSDDWRAAAYAAGVLSHYLTDPFMPLHTAQSPREAALHRPIEWSVCKSYHAILELSKSRYGSKEPTAMGYTEHWLREMIVHGATESRKYYDRLLDAYDVSLASSPSMGLNDETNDIFARLFGNVLITWGQVIDRTAAMISTELPAMSLSMATLLASVDVPLMWIVRKIGSVSERRAVQKILQEFQVHGKVERNMPRECLVVAAAKRSAQTTVTLADPVTTPETSPALPVAAATDLQSAAATTTQLDTVAVSSPLPEPIDEPAQSLANLEQPLTPTILPFAPNSRFERTKRGKLSPQSPVVEAPSIGTKTALRLAEAGVYTVEQLLRVHPAVLAARLSNDWISSDTIRLWQSQAGLACAITNLRSVDAQLLTLVGVRELADILRFDAQSLHAVIQHQAQSSAGQRILRESAPPEIDRVRKWIEEAQSAAQVA